MSGEPPRAPVNGDELLRTIEQTTGYIVNLDLPDLDDETREALIGHLTGAVFVNVWGVIEADAKP